MNEVDVAEYNSREAARFSLEGLNTARGRAHALLLVLLGGGGGLGLLGLGQWTSQPGLAVAAWAASVYWFAGAAWVAWRALSSAPVRSWATPGLLGKFDEWAAYAAESAVEGRAVDALIELRRSAIRNAELAAKEYRGASTLAYRVMDGTYRAMALTPLVSAAAWAAFQLLG